jgi:xanthine dehydrogenase molybdopterin-binding subunit B
MMAGELSLISRRTTVRPFSPTQRPAGRYRLTLNSRGEQELYCQKMGGGGRGGGLQANQMADSHALPATKEEEEVGRIQENSPTFLIV